MNKKQIRLTESDLKQIVKESVNKILNEAYSTPDSHTKDALQNLHVAQDMGYREDLKYGGSYPYKPYETLLDIRERISMMQGDLNLAII